jgi:hypothetical protein
MMNKFRTGQFGAPVPARGIGVPMEATPGRFGRATYFGPAAFGHRIPQEVAGGMKTGGNLPSDLQQESVIRRAFRKAFGIGP